MFFKCYYHLHPFTKFERDVVDQKLEEDNSLDIFEMTTNTSEPSMELINKKILILNVIKWMLKTSNVHYNVEENMKTYFL